MYAVCQSNLQDPYRNVLDQCTEIRDVANRLVIAEKMAIFFIEPVRVLGVFF